ncbi:LAMI_0E13410g1_1 [Lachancea mirantina]|uniref:LAMI_0E13410g1_1 n=1 Tax=Lachancea mirantina TaxID=1230905 RepID=A0A1G4JQS8_9SACH|nr:LAMI_0E13410g1_1 [Lachancea mirantina]
MFHRFSAAPPAKRRQLTGVRNDRASKKNNDKRDADLAIKHTILPMTKRHKISRACDRCRFLRIKCDEQKPCTRCVASNLECIVSHKVSGSQTQHKGLGLARGETREARDTGKIGDAHKAGEIGKVGEVDEIGELLSAISPRAPMDPVSQSDQHITGSSSQTMNTQDDAWMPTTSLDDAYKDILDIGARVHGFFASGELAFSHPSALTGGLFPQPPYPTIPALERNQYSSYLSSDQRKHYLQLFWDVIHPLVQVLSSTEFAALGTVPLSTSTDEYSTTNALVDSMIALAMQHSHTTGLSSRILGLQQPLFRQSYSDTASAAATWPGFEHFYRCRECMRTSSDVTLEVLRCHIFLVLYLMKACAFKDAYNLLGVTVRKAYSAKLHRTPPHHLSDCEKTARMQLWWSIFSLDLTCSLQLDMPTASQKGLIKCPLTTQDALTRYLSSPTPNDKTEETHTYSILFVNLATIVADISACVSTTDLVDGDCSSRTALEEHALSLSSAFDKLEIWHNGLPFKPSINRSDGDITEPELRDIRGFLALPTSLARKAVLLELHYHNAYTLIQRPFIRLRYAQARIGCSPEILQDSQQPNVVLHIKSALCHASAIVDLVFSVCSSCDVLYGWSEIVQPLWNASMAIISFIYSNSSTPEAQKALASLSRAQIIFELFSSTCWTANSAKEIVKSLYVSLQNVVKKVSSAAINNEPTGWDLFASLLKKHQPTSSKAQNTLSSLGPQEKFH